MFFNFFLKKTKKPDLGFFNVNLVDHCNLNCKYCDHFSPLAEERYTDIKDLERDFKRIKSLVNVRYIALMGGEPLLHPNLPQIFNMCRRVLPKTAFRLFTNGILLTKQDEKFWKSCNKNKISIHISRYPIKLDLNSIFKLSKKYKVPVFFYGGDLYKTKTMFKISLDLEGSQNQEETHRNCWQNKGGCSYFGNGKFFQCTTPGHVHHFSKFFNVDLYPSEEDYVDIYKVKSGQEIVDFYKKSIPFCKHCDLKSLKENLPFEISKKEISEWV